jgi:hypothetical protein
MATARGSLYDRGPNPTRVSRVLRSRVAETKRQEDPGSPGLPMGHGDPGQNG